MVKTIGIKANPAHFKTIYHDSIHKNDKKVHFKILDTEHYTRVKELNSKYYVPTSEQTKIISEPVRALRDQLQDESAVAPLQASRFNPIYMEPGSVQINSTKDLQTLYPHSFDQIGNMSGEYDIKIDPSIPPVQHGRCKVPIEYKATIEKELNDMV